MTGDPTTLNELFNSAVDRYRDSEYLRFKQNGSWDSLTYGEVARRVRELALGLAAMGVTRGQRIAIWSENRPEWTIADFACLAAGAVDVPVYTTQARDQVEYILSDADTQGIFVSAAFLPAALEIKRVVESIKFVIPLDEVPEDNEEGTVSIARVVDQGRALYAREPGLYERLWKQADPEDLATLLYTSGTTGSPKGVMLTHKNLAVNAANGCRWLKLDGKRELALTYLPFSHIFERAAMYMYAHTGATVAYAENFDSIAQNLQEVHPTVMTSVPRLFEKVYSRVIDKGLAAGFPKHQILMWSLDVGRRWAEQKNQGKSISTLLSLKHRIADALVFRKWREAMGSNIRVFISGGAPLAPEIAYVFEAAGLPIWQGYGLTETSPSISCNTEGRNRIGTVGPVIDGVQVKIAEDGEILVKGDNVMKGYYNRPTENHAAFTDDGWFRTGDIGHVDPDGFLVITDRKKDLLKTSGGKYIAPQRVEAMIKSSRFVSQVVVVGNARKFPAALIVPNFELLRSYAQQKGIDYSDPSELLKHPRIIDLIQRQVDKFTLELARFERVKKVALIEHEMTTGGGELTPTLKPRRSFIEKKYARVIDQLYLDRPADVAAV
jgi:long-chain acyl-CoA synthetase